MAFLRCRNCEHFEQLPSNKYKLTGLAISSFGVFGWFSFLFAGSGHAFLISSVIVIVGILVFVGADSFAKDALLKKRCPMCKKLDWDDIPYDNKN